MKFTAALVVAGLLAVTAGGVEAQPHVDNDRTHLVHRVAHLEASTPHAV
jgi:hypothetical protein